MQVIINGEPTELPRALTVTELIDHLELAGRRVAIEVNTEIVPKSEQGSYELREGDKIEIVHAIGGGAL